MTCSVEGCEKPIRALGLCKAHHLRQWRHGSPFGGSPERGQAKKFILDHVDHKGDECLTWPFYRRPDGYADVRFKDMEGMLAHRVMCVLAHGQAPSPRHNAAHSCGKGHEGCINPEHLSWKTPQENMDDKVVHGTQQSGDEIHFAKLTKEEALRIKYQNESTEDLTKKFGVSEVTIRRIRENKTWKGL